MTSADQSRELLRFFINVSYNFHGEPGPPVISSISDDYTGTQTCYDHQGNPFTGYHNFVYFNYADPDGDAAEGDGAWVTVNGVTWQWNWMSLVYGDGFSGRLRISYCNTSPGVYLTFRMYDGAGKGSNSLSIDLTEP
jgi:hypothetical protein